MASQDLFETKTSGSSSNTISSLPRSKEEFLQWMLQRLRETRDRIVDAKPSLLDPGKRSFQ